MSKPTIIIIGGGPAGLIAAKELSSKFSITVLEAQSRTGGRLHSILLDGTVVEAGAEFVHGNLPVTLSLLKEAGISYVKVKGKMYRKTKTGFNDVEEMTVGWDDLLEKMAALKADITMQELLDKYYSGSQYESLRRQVKGYSEGFDLADISKASAKALYKEWNAEDEDNYRIPAGYNALTDYLQHQAEAGGAKIHLDAIVKTVKWQKNRVEVDTANGEKYQADKLLVTVPVSVLQQSASIAAIQFFPPLHFSEKDAGNIGFGAVIKVVLKFKTAFWQKDAGFILSDELFPTWWSKLPDNIPMLTGWMGGPKAALHSNDTDEALTEKALASLAAIFEKPVAALQDEVEFAKVFNWQKNEFSMGGYSYDTVYAEKARAIISTPLAETIFFAGEALYSGDHPGTAEAAFVSGLDISEVIKNTLKG